MVLSADVIQKPLIGRRADSIPDFGKSLRIEKYEFEKLSRADCFTRSLDSGGAGPV